MLPRRSWWLRKEAISECVAVQVSIDLCNLCNCTILGFDAGEDPVVRQIQADCEGTKLPTRSQLTGISAGHASINCGPIGTDRLWALALGFQVRKVFRHRHREWGAFCKLGKLCTGPIALLPRKPERLRRRGLGDSDKSPGWLPPVPDVKVVPPLPMCLLPAVHNDDVGFRLVVLGICDGLVPPLGRLHVFVDAVSVEAQGSSKLPNTRKFGKPERVKDGLGSELGWHLTH